MPVDCLLLFTKLNRYLPLMEFGRSHSVRLVHKIIFWFSTFTSLSTQNWYHLNTPNVSNNWIDQVLDPHHSMFCYCQQMEIKVNVSKEKPCCTSTCSIYLTILRCSNSRGLMWMCGGGGRRYKGWMNLKEDIQFGEVDNFQNFLSLKIISMPSELSKFWRIFKYV